MDIVPVDHSRMLSWSEDAYQQDERVYPDLKVDAFGLSETEILWSGDPEYAQEFDKLKVAVDTPKNCREPPLILSPSPLLIFVREDVLEQFRLSFGASTREVDTVQTGGYLINNYACFAITRWVDAIDEGWTQTCGQWPTDQYYDGATLVHPVFRLTSTCPGAIYAVRNYVAPFVKLTAWNEFTQAIDASVDLLKLWRILRFDVA